MIKYESRTHFIMVFFEPRLIVQTTLFFLLMSFNVGNCLVEEKKISVRPYIREFQRFGFDEGGTVDMDVSITPSPEDVFIFICRSDEFSNLISESDNIESDSGLCLKSDCELIVNATSPLLLKDYVIQARDMYHFLVINCQGDTITANLKYTLLNPGGQQLSLGYIPLPNSYMALLILWSVFVLGWLGMWVYYRRNRVPLHTLMLSIVVQKLLVVTVGFSYWTVASKTGKSLDQLKYLESFLFAISETSFFCALLLVAKGWKITRSRLPASEVRTISVALILLLSTLLFFSFYNDGYYFLSLMIMYFFMLPKIFTSITRNSRTLDTQHMIFAHANMTNQMRAVEDKMKVFRSLRTAVVIYLGCILLVNSLQIVMVWYMEWFAIVLNQVTILCMVSYISYLLLPFRTNLFSISLLLDNSIFPLLNMDDVLSDPDLFGNDSTDISDVVVFEYPYKKPASKKNSDVQRVDEALAAHRRAFELQEIDTSARTTDAEEEEECRPPAVNEVPLAIGRLEDGKNKDNQRVSRSITATSTSNPQYLHQRGTFSTVV